MINVLGRIFGLFMNILYSFFKLKKTKDKVAFISRQSNGASLDFRYIIEEIKTNYPQYQVVTLCTMIPDSFSGKIKYLVEMLRQMDALATSKVVVLDGYCILASVLNHKKDLNIIQIWHALGSFKKFGKSILDMPGGKSSAVANAFKMHRNYDFVATSGDKCVKHFSEAFGQPEEKFIPIGIPRMDYLTDSKMNNRVKENIYSLYPCLDNQKKTILYVPTFRDKDEDKIAFNNAVEELAKNVDYSKYNLIIKHHVVDTNLEKIYIDSYDNVIEGERFTGMEFMSVSDFVVTDYSSIIYEALLKDLPLYIYCFDSEKYLDERGFYIDFQNDIPAIYSSTGKGICDCIDMGKRADAKKEAQFKQDYVNKKFDSITAVYGKLIDFLIKGNYDGRYNYKG